MSTAIGALLDLTSGIIDNAVNYNLVNKTNAQQESLMRESWSREDNAVQRRVADLKAAGLSPTLAAGSAAASSGPIKLNTPQVDVKGMAQSAIQAASAMKGLEHQDLENELLQKQIDNYGLPEGIVYMQNLFGDKWTDAIRKFGDKIYSWLSGDSSSGSSSSVVSFPQVLANVGNSLDAGFNPGFKFAFTPDQPYSSSGTTSSTGVKHPPLPAVVEDVVGGGYGSYNKENKVLVFDSKLAAKEWYLSIEGTTAEWYYGVRKYGSVEAFLDKIIGEGLWYYKH